MGHSPWGPKELDMTERLTHPHTHNGRRKRSRDPYADVRSGGGSPKEENREFIKA